MDPAAEPPESTDQVEALLGECLLRWESEGPIALDELCREHPQHAAAMRQAMTMLTDAGLTPATGPVPERLGEFRIVARLGGGGMGAVFAAEQASLHRRVALKLIRPELLFFAASRERFRREAEAIARLQHPGIVPVYAWGEEQGLPYFAMELVEGCSLAAVLAEFAGRSPADLRGGDLERVVAARAGVPTAAVWPLRGTWVEVVGGIVVAVGAALQHAHERGVLHRDVKPSNLVLGIDGRVRLVDFGLARSDGDHELTRSGTPVGSLAYMSPEQLLGRRDVDARTDVYSLGVTLQELLTLRRAFAAADAEGLRTAVLAGRRTALADRRSAARRDLETVCATAMAVEPARRYATVAALCADVQAVLDGRPIAARPIGLLRRVVRHWRRRPVAALAALGLLVLVPALSLAVWSWWQARADGSVGRSYLRRTAAAREVTEAFFAYKGGAAAEAEPRFDAVLAGDAGNELALLGRLLCALSAADGVDLERVLAAHPAVVAAHPMFGWFGVEAARLQGRAADADARAAQLPAEPPPGAVDWFVQGVLESWRGREGDGAHFTAALHAIEQAILLDRSDVRTPIFHVYAAETAALCGDRDVALRAARAIETLWPDSALALASAGRSLMAADGERSLALLTRARDLAPDRAVVQLYLAESLLFQDRADEAAVAYEAALRLDDRLGSAWGGLCLLHLGQGRIERAVECSARYVEVEPGLGLAWKVRAQSLHLARLWQQARDAYAKAVQHMPADAVVHRGYAAVLDHLGDTAAAAAERERFATPR